MERKKARIEEKEPAVTRPGVVFPLQPSSVIQSIRSLNPEKLGIHQLEGPPVGRPSTVVTSVKVHQRDALRAAERIGDRNADLISNRSGEVAGGLDSGGSQLIIVYGESRCGTVANHFRGVGTAQAYILGGGAREVASNQCSVPCNQIRLSARRLGAIARGVATARGGDGHLQNTPGALAEPTNGQRVSAGLSHKVKCRESHYILHHTESIQITRIFRPWQQGPLAVRVAKEGKLYYNRNCRFR